MDVKKININQSEQTYNIASEIYDVSAHNNDTSFESLQSLLSSSNLGTLIPTQVRHGGMTIRFIQSSDNKYVQYRLMSNVWSTNVADWQGVDDLPIVGSDNIVKSGGVANAIETETARAIAAEQANNTKLIDLKTITSLVSMEMIETENESIIIEDNNGNILADITCDSFNFKNLKSNGKDVLTEHQSLSDYAKKIDIPDVSGLKHESTEDSIDNVAIYDDDGIELIHYIDKEGANFKNLKSDGVAVAKVGDSYTKEEADAITLHQDISTISLYNVQTKCISANYDENVFDYAEPTGKRISAQLVMKNIQGASQGGACYGNTLFVFSPHYQPMIISVVNLDKMQKVQEIEDVDNRSKQYHNNSAMFGNVKYDESDPFPLLYVSSCYETIGFAGIRVFRITGEEGSYNMEVVQKIEIPKKSDTYDSTEKDSYIIGNYIYCIGNSSGDYYNISKFELPSVGASIVTYTEEDILEQFTVSSGGRTRQGGFVKNGHIIAAHSNGLHDIDLENKSASYFIFPYKLRMCETEFCFEYDENLYVSAILKPANFDVPSNQTNLYIIKFYK